VTACDVIDARPIDDAVSTGGIFDLPADVFQSLRDSLVRDYVDEVIDACEPYGRYVAAQGVGRDAPFRALPPIPTSIFKHAPLVTVATDRIQKWSVSSGTRGAPSHIGRDRTSLERLLASVRVGLAMFDDWHEEEITVLHLGPSYEHAGDLWLPYVMSLTELVYPTISFATDAVLDLDAALAAFTACRAAGDKVGIIGPPFAVARFCEAYAAQGLAPDGGRDVVVITAGGWKDQVPQMADRGAFRAWIVDVLGLTDATRVRDAFSQVELNTVLFECDSHRFHLPPWIFATARCPRTLAPLSPRETGLLGYIDASASSWPCVIVGDDIGQVDDMACACGRSGDLLHVDRRLERGLGGGCALTLIDRFGER
jgi:long-chain-fatty-acid---luciferin-component ligase